MDINRIIRDGQIKALHDLYPGHVSLEFSVFTRNPVTKTIDNKYDVVAVSNEECMSRAKAELRQNSLQFISFRANLTRQAGSDSQQINADIDNLVCLLDQFHFPLSPVLSARQDTRMQISWHFDTNSKGDEPTFYSCGGRFCVIWRYYTATQSTRAVMFNFVKLDYNYKTSAHEFLRQIVLPKFQSCFGHPMLIAIALVHSEHLEAISDYTQDSHDLHEIEGGFVTLKSAARIHTMSALRDLARSTSRDKYTFVFLQKALDFARRADKEIASKSLEPTVNAWPGMPFTWHLDEMYEALELDLALLGSILESVANQQAAVASIVNLQDGASMKTIAAITMAFLPATFVSALFAMPMFQWNENEARFVSREFWIYWATVLPLTATVFLIWLGWWYWHSIRTDYDDPDSPPLTDFMAWLKRAKGGFLDPRGRKGGVNEVEHDNKDQLRFMNALRVRSPRDHHAITRDRKNEGV